MTETYCVVAQVSGFATDDDVKKAEHRGHKLDKDAHNADLVDEVMRIIDEASVDVMIRDDGTGEVVVEWVPKAEEDGTQSWQQAKDSIEQIRSAIVGAGLATLNPVKVELRDIEPKTTGKVVKRKSTKKAAAAKS
jgi:hypothetical protein